MKGDGLIPDAPNLDALSAQQPRRKLTVVRLLWPKIRACLDRGHTVREIRERLRLDGLEVNYKNLCACIAQLRQQDGAGMFQTTAQCSVREYAGMAVAKRAVASDDKAPLDPLANVRRLTEDRRPGFNYPGTLSEKDLFGE
jgi:hypothetical protein